MSDTRPSVRISSPRSRLFVDADGTAQREAVRRWHLGTVLPLARILEAELTAKLEAEVRLTFDAYPLDLAGRAQAFQKLVAGGVSVTEALGTSGLLARSDGTEIIPLTHDMHRYTAAVVDARTYTSG